MENKENPPNQVNVNYKSDIEYAINLPRMLLVPIGIWPLQRGDSFSDIVKTYVHTVVMFVLFCFFLIPQVIYTFVDCEDLSRYAKVIASQLFVVLAMIKFWTLAINRKELRHCLTTMEDQYRNVEWKEDLAVMKKSAKIGRFWTTFYLSLSYGGGLPYHIVLPLISEKIVMSDNTTRLPLPYQSNYVFFVIEHSPAYEIIFIVQILISAIILSTNCGIYSLVINIAMHCCGLFEVTNRRLEVVFAEDRQGLRSRMVDVVKHHLKAIEFTRATESGLSIVFLTEMVCGTVIICLIEYGILVDMQDGNIFTVITYVILLMSFFIDMYILSFIGDHVKQKSEKVSEMTYFMQWYDLSEDLAKNVQIILLRANRPVSLTAGKLFDLSLQGFCDVCKTSAAYFNFLRAVMD